MAKREKWEVKFDGIRSKIGGIREEEYIRKTHRIGTAVFPGMHFICFHFPQLLEYFSRKV